MSLDRPPESRERARLEAILQTAVDAIITIDERGIIESANPAIQSLFGYSCEEVVGKNVSMLMPAPYREEHDGYLRNYLTTGEKKIIGIGREVIGLHKDGTSFPMHLAVSETLLNGRKIFTGIVRDLTALRSAEAEQARLGRVLEESLNEIYFFAADSLKFVQVNRGARHNLGYSMEELEEMTPIDIKPEFDRERFLDMIAPLQRGEADKQIFESIHQRKDGSFYDVEVHLQLSRIQHRPVFVAIVLDTTRRKELERERQRINEELEQRVRERTEQLRAAQAELVRKEKLAMLGQVSGGIAHEIRNPLNAVKASAYYLLHAKQLTPEKMKEHLDRIDRQVSLIDNVVTALSDVAKLPAPQMIPLELGGVLSGVLQSVSCPDNIQTELHLPADLPPVWADEYQIPIAFRNLIRNARDAMPEGGTITVRAQVVDDQVEIFVMDQGMGIPAADLARIMEPLFSTKARGMGLGLAITKAILEKNRGTIDVESEVGVGSFFRITLAPAPAPAKS